VTDEVKPEPWEPQRDETPRAYTAFLVYRDLGPRRSLRKAAPIVYDLPTDEQVPLTSPKLRQLKTWSAEFQWVNRAHAWDVHLDDETRYEQVEAVKEMRRRHAAVANMALAKAAERLREMTSKEMTVRDAASLLDLAVKVERLARGEATANLAHSGQGGGPIEVEVKTGPDELRNRLEAMLERAEAFDAEQTGQNSEHESDDNEP
jgi:hypothetical protein